MPLQFLHPTLDDARKEAIPLSSDCLLLNFTYEPLGVVDVTRAVRLLFARKVEIVHAGAGEIRSVTAAFPLP